MISIDTKKKRWLPIMALAGVAILALLVVTKETPRTLDTVNVSPLIEVHKVTLLPFNPMIKGFGRVRPRESWAAISEVKGRVIYRHPDLEKGRTLPAGTLVIKIDPVDYQLSLAQSRSNLKSAELELERVNLNKNAFLQSQQIEQGRLSITKQELKRKEDLKQQGLVSSSELEAQRNLVLAQEKVLWDLDSKLALIPTDRDVAEANLKVAQAKVQEAERALQRTQVSLPFNARIGEVNVELDQVVNQQQTMLEAHDMSHMEITANMSLFDMRRLVEATSGEAFLPGETMPDIRNLPLEASIILFIGDSEYQWQGVVDRVDDSIDITANTIGLTVQVDNRLSAENLKKAPPLLKDMYVQVSITGQGKKMLTVPTRAMHGNLIYVVDHEQNLRFRKVEVAYQQGDVTALSSGIAEGEWVIMTDLLAPVEGMKVRIAGTALPVGDDVK